MKQIKRVLRRFLSLFCERMAYWLGLNTLFYYLNRKVKRIITFHHVFPDELMAKVEPDCLAHSLSDFKKIVEMLKKRYSFSLDINDVKSVTLTFDDGYQSQYECVFKVLTGGGGQISAYIFVSGRLLQEKTPLIVDLLTAWCKYAPEEFTGSNRALFWQNVIRPRYLQDRESFGMNVLKELDAQFPIDKMIASLPEDYRKLRFKGLTPDMLVEMKAAGWGIGGHGYHHFPFGYLSPEDCEADIKAGSEALKPYQTTTVYSYPFGGLDTIGDIAPQVVEQIGATCSVANEVQPGWTTDKWHLPRMALSADKYAFHFELSGCKYFFRHRKLLPIVKV